MTREQRSRYKQALIETVSRFRQPLFHVTAMLPPGCSRPALEDLLRGWAARVDRHYLGRNWHVSGGRMDGVVFFELYPDHHGHLIVTPPIGASPLHFLMNAQFWFAPDPRREHWPVRPTPLAAKGKMMIQQIAATAKDLERVTGYAAKETEFLPSAITDWKFVSDLSRR